MTKGITRQRRSSSISGSKKRLSSMLKSLEAETGLSVRRETKAIAYLLLDASGSMSTTDKVAQARAGVRVFAEDAYLKGYIVGLISFGSDAQLVCEPRTTDLQRFVDKIDFVGSTNMAAAIRMAVSEFQQARGRKAIAIVTDGYPNDEKVALVEARKAKEENIAIITIGTEDADHSFLRKLATTEELSMVVNTKTLAEGMKSAAKLLPKA